MLTADKLNRSHIYKKVLEMVPLDHEEGCFLYTNESTASLVYLADEIKKALGHSHEVSWMIDRNVNISNACQCRCRFCNFHRAPGHKDVFVTTLDEYKVKIQELFELGGDQVLLQGGLHPDLDLAYYTELFRELKQLFPTLKLHALGPPEVDFLARKSGIPVRQALESLVNAGLDSLPGAGAEILVDRVRKIVSPGKCNSQTWLDVMSEAHAMGLVTSATMMFGHAETKEERVEHMIRIRDLQSSRPEGLPGFLSFICWPFQDKGTVLHTKYDIRNTVSTEEYIRTIALARIMLPNISNIQASWLTVGLKTAQVCLHAGANDLGSIMIEENVVSSAGANFRVNRKTMEETIRKAGFVPVRRNQRFEIVER
jgi:cyclic dehypoxanthinyl futalosine synthase